MSTETTTEAEEAEEWTPASMEQLTHFWTSEGIPVFVANGLDICDHIESHGYQLYYVMAYAKDEKKQGAVTKTEYRPSLWKVMNTIISRVVMEAEPDEIALDTFDEEAHFVLPKIPNVLRQQMDDFFRTVDDMYGTESIVILTFDNRCEGPEGWGILVPKQENNSTHCKYDHESVIEAKPDDEVYIVGSAHSHPGMPAYASGTDHQDQADFDGLHITYGWSGKTAGNTEYYAELQMGGVSYKIKSEHIFESDPDRQISEEVKGWAEKVSKSTPIPPKQNTGHSQIQGWGPGQRGSSQNPGVDTSKGGEKAEVFRSKMEIPKGCPDPFDNIIITEIDNTEANCPWCSSKIIKLDVEKRRCMSCKQYISLPGEDIRDIVKVRNDTGNFTYELDIDNGNVTKPIYMWKRGGQPEFSQVFTPEKSGGQGK